MKMIKGTIKKNIIAGLLVTVPVSLTYIVLKFVITRIDALVVPVVSKIIGEKAMENFNGYFVPGMGFLILIFFICSVIYILAHYKLKSKYHSSLPKFLLLIIGLLWVILFFQKMIHIPFKYGFDSPLHLEYTDYLLRHGSLPMAYDGWELYHPPSSTLSPLSHVF